MCVLLCDCVCVVNTNSTILVWKKPNMLYYPPRKTIADVFCFEQYELEQRLLTVDNLKLLG